MRAFLLLSISAVCLALAGCMTTKSTGSFGTAPHVGHLTSISEMLAKLPPPPRRIAVAVYDFPDLTGANRPNDNFADYSKAVTQGAASIVMDALKTAGEGKWFKVVERNRLDDLLRERKLITSTFTALGYNWRNAIKPLEFPDYMITGGIVSYDAAITSGGIGASYLGVGGSVNYRRDLVTINLRLVSIVDGSVVKSVNSSRTVFSMTPATTVTRYVSLGNLLSVEAGISVSEAPQIAVREAIEAAVHELITDGMKTGLWARDPKNADPKPSLTSQRRPMATEALLPPEAEAERLLRDPRPAPAPPKLQPGDPEFKLRGAQTW